MTDFDIDRLNNAIRTLNAMNEQPTQPPMVADESREEARERTERIEALAAMKLQDVAFICEAWSEIPSLTLLEIASFASSCDPYTDYRSRQGWVKVAAGLRAYAFAVAEKELSW